MDIENKIKHLMEELERNGELSLSLGGDLPAVLAAIPDGPAFDLLDQTCRQFRNIWEPRQPDIAMFWRYIVDLIHRDQTRRALMENIEVGQLERLLVKS
jgi:hypothetical protein